MPGERERPAEQTEQTEQTGVTSGVRLRNLSARRVLIRGRSGAEVQLPPLAEHLVDSGQRDAFAWDVVRSRDVVDVQEQTSEQSDAVFGVIGGVLIVGFTGCFVVAGATHSGWWVLAWLGAVVVAGVVVGNLMRSSWLAVGRWLREKLALAFVLLVGFGIPAAVLLFATGLFDDLRNHPGAALDPGLNRVVTYRLLQVLFLGIATTFPALLYFLFDRQHVATLRNRFLLALFRLDRRLVTSADWQSRYGRQVSEAFGDLYRRGSARLTGSRRTPVVVATVVLAIGWVLAFLNLDAVQLKGGQAVLSGGSLLQLFQPERGVVAFGFLGAYFFGVNTVLRSYLRGDLRPKAYSQITTRVLIIIVLSSVIALTSWGDEPVVLTVAFFAGIVPDTVLQWIWERLPRNEDEGGLVERQPLTVLEGIDLYDRARLAEEGVTNVESLAHGDLVELLLQTRIPPGRLVDWVDQAVLRLHLGTLENSPFVALRPLGVRSATDLLTVSEGNEGRLLAAMGQAGDDAALARLQVLRGALADAEWVPQLLSWRQDAECDEIVIDAAAPVAEQTLAPVAPAPAPAPAAAATTPADPDPSLRRQVEAVLLERSAPTTP